MTIMFLLLKLHIVLNHRAFRLPTRAAYLLFLALCVSCSSIPQQSSSTSPEIQNVYDNLEQQTGSIMDPDFEEDESSLASATNGEESLEQIFADGEMEPLSDEDIPLPNPEEIASFENEDFSTAQAEPEIQYDFPVTVNRQVEYFLDKYQNSQRQTFRKWLERSGRYLPMIQEELRQAGMPLDLVYLPMIESGYRLTAYSRARAVGPWQFIRSTGRRYGLAVNNYVDERRDPIKATRAAIAFLSDLYKEFNSWPLAVAAYNAGQGRVRKAIRKTGSRDFWELAKTKHLKKETRYYVPKLIAAILIAKDPSSYGFDDIVYDEPLAFETIDVPKWTALQAVAIACDEPLEDIRNLNRQLRHAITPPGNSLYSIKVPVGKKELLAENLPRVAATVTTGYKTHVVRRGETVTRICNKYNINKKTFLKSNNLRTANLKSGQRLRIPYKTTSYKLMDENMMSAGLGPAKMLPENLVMHKVRPGETISELASRYNVSMHMIAAWNGINDLGRIRAGQQLAFYLQDLKDYSDDTSSKKEATQNDERTAKVAIPDAGTRNNLGPESDADKGRLTYYQVRGGDSLWTIARRFQTTPEKIRRWNSIEGDKIFPGHRLLLKVENDLDA